MSDIDSLEGAPSAPPNAETTINKNQFTGNKGHEKPKHDATVHVQPLKDQAAQREKTELDLKAEELAAATREQGMGILRGKFPKAIAKSDTGNDMSVLGFIKGEVVGTQTEYTGQTDRNFERMLGGSPPELRQTKNTHRQTWLATVHNVATQKHYEQVKGGLFGLLTKTITKDIPITYHGKRGGEDWVHFSYIQPADSAYDPNHRPGVEMELDVVVPPEIAEKLDSEVARDPYFPDAYMKALYPNLIGTDIKTQVKRVPATELLTVDQRPNSKNTQGEVRTYPKPIPY